MGSDGFEDDDFIDDGDGIVIYYRTALYVHVCESIAQFIYIRFGWSNQRWTALSRSRWGPKHLVIRLVKPYRGSQKFM